MSRESQQKLLIKLRDELSQEAEIFRIAEADKKFTTFTMNGRSIKEAIRARLFKKLGPQIQKYSGSKAKDGDSKLSREDVNNIIKTLNSPIKTAIDNTKRQMFSISEKPDSLVKVVSIRGGFQVAADYNNGRSNYDLIKRNYQDLIVELSNKTVVKISEYLTEKGIDFNEDDIKRDFSSGKIFALEHSEDGGVAETQALAAIENAVDMFGEDLLQEMSKEGINSKKDLVSEVVKYLVDSDDGVTIESFRNPELGTQDIKLFLGSFVLNSIEGGKSSQRKKKLIQTINRLVEEKAVIFANAEGSDSLIGASRKRVGRKALDPFIEVASRHKAVKITQQEDYNIKGKKSKIKLKDASKSSTKNLKLNGGSKLTPASIGVSSTKNPAENLLNLQSLLNSKLPGVVRKNMGYPALTNKTGNFASSVKVTDITTTKKGFPSVGYTYDKNPYQVFEQGAGRTPWANADRDPRKLIDRSIREIAAELALGRFFTRRT